METAPALPIDDILRIMAMVPSAAPVCVVGSRADELARPLRDLGFDLSAGPLEDASPGAEHEWIIVWHEHSDGDPALIDWLTRLQSAAARGAWLFTVMHVPDDTDLTVDDFLIQAERAGFTIASDVQRTTTETGRLFQAAHRHLN